MMIGRMIHCLLRPPGEISRPQRQSELRSGLCFPASMIRAASPPEMLRSQRQPLRAGGRTRRTNRRAPPAPSSLPTSSTPPRAKPPGRTSAGRSGGSGRGCRSRRRITSARLTPCGNPPAHARPPEPSLAACLACSLLRVCTLVDGAAAAAAQAARKVACLVAHSRARWGCPHTPQHPPVGGRLAAWAVDRWPLTVVRIRVSRGRA